MIRNSLIPKTTFLTLVAASLANMIADVLLFYGNSVSNQDISILLLYNSDLTFIQIGALAGLFSIPFWLLPASHLSKIANNNAHSILMTHSYVAFVLGALAYHLAYGYLGNSVHICDNTNLNDENGKLLLINGLYNFVAALVFSITVIMAKIKGNVSFHWVNYFFLPFPAILLFQILFNQLITIPAPVGGYFAATNGTLVILLFFISLSKYKIKTQNES